MSRYPSESRVIVESLARQRESDGILVGRKDLGRFLLLPADAVEILDDLAAGATVGEAQRGHQERYGETADLEDLLTSLEGHGFVRPLAPPDSDAAPERPPRRPAKAYHFEWISQRAASRLYAKPMLVAGALLVALAVAAVALKPSIVPGWRAVYFPVNTAAGLLFLMVTGLATTFLHEMGHLVAARARGVSCRLGIGNQLWFVVWETDMTGIWALPRRQRYLPILGGPLVDLLSASALLVIFFLDAGAWIALPPRVLQFGQALLFIYLMRILWQCYFFLRTDFYYAMANWFGCRSLMQDTKVLLKNLSARFLRIGRPSDQSHLPATERRMIRIYAVVWLTGRALAFALLIFIQIPLLFHYLALLFGRIRDGSLSGVPNESILPLLTAIVFSLFLLTGLGLWLRSLWPKKGTSA